MKQYFYKRNRCPAKYATDPECHCWHDQGTGPFPDAEPENLTYGLSGYVIQLEWRDKPSVEVLGETCIDGGKCHHKCSIRCLRRECCVPFSDYSGPWAYPKEAELTADLPPRISAEKPSVTFGPVTVCPAKAQAPKFEREDRYLVIKYKDLAKVPAEHRLPFMEYLDDINAAIPHREFVVVESDWPEYEKVWQMIEERVANEAHAAHCSDPQCERCAYANNKGNN